MFRHQNQGSNIWGSRDIKRFRTRRTYYKMTKKIFWVFRNQGVMKRGEMQKYFFNFWSDYHAFRSERESKNQALGVETANPLYIFTHIIRLLYKVADFVM